MSENNVIQFPTERRPENQVSTDDDFIGVLTPYEGEKALIPAQLLNKIVRTSAELHVGEKTLIADDPVYVQVGKAGSRVQGINKESGQPTILTVNRAPTVRSWLSQLKGDGPLVEIEWPVEPAKKLYARQFSLVK